MNNRTLRFAVIRKLFEPALKDRTGILNCASDCSEKFQFHPAVPPLDLRLFTEVAS